MKFSIIIPVYNVEKYLEQCLNSVLNQTFTDYEIICVNDGSTDGSLEILKNYEQKFTISNLQFTIINQENGGLSDARNTGIRAAKGDYIFLLDSDDWITENALEVLNKNTKNQDFVAFSGERFFESGKTEIPDKGISEPQLTGWEYYNKYALQGRNFHFVCVVLRIYRREFLIENNLFFKKGIYHEDNLFTPVCCYYAENIKVIPDILYVYRIREGSITQTLNEKRIFDIIYVANELADFFLKTKEKNLNTIFHDLAYYYPNILINVRNANRKDLVDKIYAKINWGNYKKISRGTTDKLMFYLVKHKIPLFYHYQQIKKIKRQIFN